MSGQVGNFSQKGFTKNFLNLMSSVEQIQKCCLSYLTGIYTKDTPSIAFSGDGSEANPLMANSIISPDAGNALSIHVNGLYAPAASGALSVQAQNGVGLDSASTATAPIIVFGDDVGSTAHGLLTSRDFNMNALQINWKGVAGWNMLWDFSSATTNPVQIFSNSAANTLLLVSNIGTGGASAAGFQMAANTGNSSFKMCGTAFTTVGTNAYGPSMFVISNSYGSTVMNSRQGDIYFASNSHDLGNTGIQRGFVGGGGTPYRNIFLAASSAILPLPDDNNLMQVNGGNQSITGGNLQINAVLGVTTTGALFDTGKAQFIDTANATQITKNNLQVNAPIASLGTFFATADIYGSISTKDPDTGLNDAAWQMGKVVAGAVAIDNAHYVSITINGVVVKLLKAL